MLMSLPEANWSLLCVEIQSDHMYYVCLSDFPRLIAVRHEPVGIAKYHGEFSHRPLLV